jgi:hypothetical protein
MYSFEQHVRVMLQFRAMDAPVEISVPWNVLFYLDMHAERSFAADGTVVYRHAGQTEAGRRMALTSMPPACTAA